MILFPSADRNAIPRSCECSEQKVQAVVKQRRLLLPLTENLVYEKGDIVAHMKSAARLRKITEQIRRELPQRVQKRVERRFHGATLEIIDGLVDIVRSEIYEMFEGQSPPRSSGSSRDSPQPAPTSLGSPSGSRALGGGPSGVVHLADVSPAEDEFLAAGSSPPDDHPYSLGPFLSGISEFDLFQQPFHLGADYGVDCQLHEGSTLYTIPSVRCEISPARLHRKKKQGM
ncbi:hypothetical protein BX600DRAFT_430923 [Xylariales sp. PMI_506]|nr:hypothetical protein BX600DRAFT_430923 [Xylariales sp. PMI_506]